MPATYFTPRVCHWRERENGMICEDIKDYFFRLQTNATIKHCKIENLFRSELGNPARFLVLFKLDSILLQHASVFVHNGPLYSTRH